ncbi:hypothetical protein Tco_1403704 [Tanacetum coccineum]
MLWLTALKWIYKEKLDEYGDVLKNKARFSYKGVSSGRKPEGGDLKTEENPPHIYRLKKALYGLNQRTMSWYDTHSKFLLPTLSFKGCARYQAKPTKKYFEPIKRVFRYLKGTINMGLWYPKDNAMSLTAYTDADHVGCQDSRRSTPGSAQFLGDRLVSWSSKNTKHCNTTTEAEYIAMSGITLALNTSTYGTISSESKWKIEWLNSTSWKRFISFATFTPKHNPEMSNCLLPRLGMKEFDP